MNTQTEQTTLDTLTFDNRFTRELPADLETENYRRQVRDACYSRVKPTPVSNPKLVAYAKEVANLIDLSQEACESDLFTQVFVGNHLLEGMDPFAMCYGGHQFGNWAGQLGDGRWPRSGRSPEGDGAGNVRHHRCPRVATDGSAGG